MTYTHSSDQFRPQHAPIPDAVRKQLQCDLDHYAATMIRKGFTPSDCHHEQSTSQAHFEFGCWLFYYRNLIDRDDGLAHRVDCARRIIEAGFWYTLANTFLVVFDFGSRQLDVIFEMGDSDLVVAGLVTVAQNDPDGAVAQLAKILRWIDRIQKQM